VTTYNNFYEFGTAKSDPSENAKNFRTIPWTVSTEGAVSMPHVLDLDALFQNRTARRTNLQTPAANSREARNWSGGDMRLKSSTTCLYGFIASQSPRMMFIFMLRSLPSRHKSRQWGCFQKRDIRAR
jgi:hypothetical protein